MEFVLLLNQGFEPVSIINWKKAVCLLILEKAEVVEEYGEKISSPNWSMNFPAVIRLVRSFKRIQKEVAFNKRNIFARDNWTCQYCKEKFCSNELTLDHIIPKAKGGLSAWDNIVACCRSCNGKKGSKTLSEAGLQLSKKPTRPTWVPILRTLASQNSLPTEWKNFF